MAKARHETETKPLLDLIVAASQGQEETMARLRAMIALPKPADQWRGILAVPPGSLMETILADFRRNTDIPLELPFFSIFAVLAGYLLHSGVSVIVGDEKVDGYDDFVEEIHVLPDIWLLLIAPSGSSKTLTFSKIRESADADERLKDTHFQLDGIQSDAAFFDIIEKHNCKLGVRDEFNEFYKQLKSGKSLEKCRDTLLKIYSHDKLQRDTHKDGTREINSPAICLLGMTIKDSFCETIATQADDLINGLLQRFLPVIATLDPQRKMIDFPIYRFHQNKWKIQWKKLLDSIKFKEYKVSELAMRGYFEAFRLLFSKDIDPSFYRRVLWSAHKYALLYHILCGHGDQQEIGAEAYGWAARVLSLHLADLKDLFFSSAMSPLQRTLEKVETLIQRLRTEGRPVTARAIVVGVRDIRSVAEARAILQMLSEKEDTPSKK